MATQSNIMSDLSTLTKIPVKILTEINKKECLCIGSAIHDTIVLEEPATVLNIGIGTLSVDIATKQCKFVPGKELKAAIKKAIDGKIDPVEFEIEQEMIDKLLNVCDEVL